MTNLTMTLGFAVFFLAAIVMVPGCLSPSSPAQGVHQDAFSLSPAETERDTATDLRYSFSVPEYVSTDWIENRQWTAKITVTNVGNAAADGYCINVSLIKNTTGEVVDSRYVQYSCGEGCIAPGTFHDNVVTFRPGWQTKGYYRVVGGSCGGTWLPVLPMD